MAGGPWRIALVHCIWTPRTSKRTNAALAPSDYCGNSGYAVACRLLVVPCTSPPLVKLSSLSGVSPPFSVHWRPQEYSANLGYAAHLLVDPCTCPAPVINELVRGFLGLPLTPRMPGQLGVRGSGPDVSRVWGKCLQHYPWFICDGRTRVIS